MALFPNEDMDLADDDYSDDEPEGSPSSSAKLDRKKKREGTFHPGTRPACELALYVKETKTGVWEVSRPEYGAKRVSKYVFFCLMRRKITKLTAAEEEEGRNDTAGRDACEDDDMDMLLKIVNGKIHPQAHMDWIAMENYAQKYHKGSSFAKCISSCEEMACKMAHATSANLKKLRAEALKMDLEPMPLTVLVSLRQSLVRPAGDERTYGEGESKVKIPGQGVAYPTVYGYVNACSFFHRIFGMPLQNPTRDAQFMGTIKALRDAHKTVHVACLDVLEDLPFLRAAVFGDTDTTDGEKLHLWALILVALEHGCRLSEVSVYSPTLSQVKTPSASRTHAWDSNGWPKWLEITRDKWKRKKLSQSGVTQQLHANMVDGGADYCSVTAVLFLLRYYDLHGITQGPLFRNFAKSTKRKERAPVQANHEQKDQKVRGSGASQKRSRWWASYDEETGKYSHEASLSEDQVYNMLNKVFDSASELAREAGSDHTRLAAATPHSFRASMVGWAARSRSSNAYNEARLAGRWAAGSTVFNIYWKFGMEISVDVVGATRGEDKIFSFKPWPAGGTTTSLSAETSGVVPVEGDVNMRKRKRGELNEEGKKRRKIKAQNFKRTVKETQKVSEARLSKFPNKGKATSK